MARSHRRAMSCQISSTQVVDASRGSVVRSHRRVMHGPVGPHNKLALMPPPPLVRTEKQLSAPADRPVRDPAHAVAFTTAVAVGGSASVRRRTGMRAARALHGDRNGPWIPRPPTHRHRTDRRRRRSTTCVARPSTAPRGVVTQVPTSAERWAFVLWGAHADPILRLASGQGTGTLCPSTLCPSTLCPKEGGEDDTERTARARGVSRGEPAESHAARS